MKKRANTTNLPSVLDYYATRESRWGYKLFLANTRHFGYYRTDTVWPFPISTSLRAMEEKLFTSLDLPVGSLVLDSGAGVANVASFLATKGLKIEAIDLVDRHVSIAKKNVVKRKLEELIHVSNMNYQDLTFQDKSFDGVYTMETFVHATDPEKALSEFHRVLKPGGKLVMFEYDRAEDKDIPVKAQKAFYDVNAYASMPTFQKFSYGAPEKMLREAGFKNIKIEDVSHNILPMLRFFALAAFLPYQFIKLFRVQSRFVNAMSAVEYYKHRQYMRYVVITAEKSN